MNGSYGGWGWPCVLYHLTWRMARVGRRFCAIFILILFRINIMIVRFLLLCLSLSIIHYSMSNFQYSFFSTFEIRRGVIEMFSKLGLAC